VPTLLDHQSRGFEPQSFDRLRGRLFGLHGEHPTETHTTGGRDGASRSSDGRLDVQLSTPGSTGDGTNPEQMFAAGWSACFIGAMGLAATKTKVALPADTAVDAEVDLRTADGAYFLQARLNVSLPGVEREVAESLAHAALGLGLGLSGLANAHSTGNTSHIDTKAPARVASFSTHRQINAEALSVGYAEAGPSKARL
jgi:Ohr subfamily peroxiredoxin